MPSNCPLCGTPYSVEQFDHEFGVQDVEVAGCDCDQEED
jgi:hypothetical protein